MAVGIHHGKLAEVSGIIHANPFRARHFLLSRVGGMNDPAPLPGRHDRVRHGSGRLSWRALWILAVVFTVATTGYLVLVALDLVIGRPAAGDIFIAFLNSLVALVLWRRISEQARA